LKEIENDVRTLESMFDHFAPLSGVGHICEVTRKFLWGCQQLEAMLGGPCLNTSPTDFLSIDDKPMVSSALDRVRAGEEECASLKLSMRPQLVSSRKVPSFECTVSIRWSDDMKRFLWQQTRPFE
jgi:hypothetical protein